MRTSSVKLCSFSITSYHTPLQKTSTITGRYAGPNKPSLYQHYSWNQAKPYFIISQLRCSLCNLYLGQISPNNKITKQLAQEIQAERVTISKRTKTNLKSLKSCSQKKIVYSLYCILKYYSLHITIRLVHMKQ